MNRKSNPNSSVEPSTTYHVDIPLGSSPRNKPIVAAALAEREGIPLQKTAGYLFFDWKDDLRGSTNGELDHRIIEAFGPGSFVAAIPPSDPQALQKAEDRGDLWLVDEGWHRNPGAMAEMRGATGEPRNGQQLALLNSRLLKSTLGRILQEARSHTGQDQRVLQGMEEVPIRVPVLVDYVTVGGLGSGSACWFLDDGIRSCAEYNGVQANIVVHATCRGSLSAKDVEKADLNESIALRYLQALPSGQYLSPLSGQRHPAFDTLFLWSNENCHGDMTDLGQVMVQRGHCQYFLYSTDAGARMRTALVDILDHTPNEHGAPRPGLTMGLASLTRDSDRLLLHCQYDAAATMAEALRAPSDPEEARQEATHLARQLKIVESGEENILTAMLSHPSGLDGESVIERAKASFQSRTAGTGGLEAAFVTEESLRAIIDGDIPQVYGAMVREHARNQAAWVQEALQTYQQKAMKRPDGLSRCLGVLALFDPIVRQSAESLMAKARELTELARPHEQIVAEASEQVSELAQRSRPARWVNHLLIRRLSTALQESGISLITYTLEITVCEIAVAEFLTPITEQLDRLRGWLTGMDHKLIQTARICEAKAHSAVEKRTIDQRQSFLPFDDN